MVTALVLAAVLLVQDAPPPPAPPAIDAAAREIWERACNAALRRPSRAAEPVRSFDLSFEVLYRGDTGSQDIKPRVRWLAGSREERRPDFVRFGISKNREVGLGPDGYWLREDGKAVALVNSRDYTEDRRQLDQLLLVVRNFVALTQPGNLDLRELSLLEDAPEEIPRRHDLGKVLRVRDKDGESKLKRDRLVWIELVSPDFQLAVADRFDPFAERALCRVRLGVDRETSLAIVAILEDTERKVAPILLYLDDHKGLDDLHVPRKILVYGFEPAGDGALVVAAKPGQELYVQGGTVRAELEPDEFAAHR